MSGRGWHGCLIAAILVGGCRQSEAPIPAATDTVQRQLVVVDTSHYLSAVQLAAGLQAAPTFKKLKGLRAPFDSLQFDKAVAYDYNGSKGEQSLYIIEDGQLARTVLAQQPLGRSEIEAVLGLLTSRQAYGDAPAFCFEPHLGIVLYRSDSVVGHLSICISCKRLASSPALSPGTFRRIQVDETSSYPADGLNDRSLAQLRQWLQRWQFREF